MSGCFISNAQAKPTTIRSGLTMPPIGTPVMAVSAAKPPSMPVKFINDVRSGSAITQATTRVTTTVSLGVAMFT